MVRSRMAPAWPRVGRRRGQRWVGLALVWFLAGCASSPSWRDTTQPASNSGGAAAVQVLGDSETWKAPAEALESRPRDPLEALAEVALSLPPEMPLEALVLPQIAGRECDFFSRLLGRAAHEARDVGPVIEQAGELVGRSAGAHDLLAFVREITHRSCCLRRSFLAAGLDGWVRGLEQRDDRPPVDPEVARRLTELASNPDAGLARAAYGALPFFSLEDAPAPAP